jgi:pyruvate carboxylase
VAAIHPGWGFASEDCTFPAKCAEAGIVFIGPDASSMELLGNKVAVKNVARELGIPVVPGSSHSVSVPEAREIARDITFPIMLKAEGGGGGRGIYVVHEPKHLEEAFSKASALAQASSGNPRLYVEKYLGSVRHIEIQVIADTHGNVLALDERDCTVQRNHQKLVEITPSPWKGMTRELREQLKAWAEQLVKHVGYHSLATVEFLVAMSEGKIIKPRDLPPYMQYGIAPERDMREGGLQMAVDELEADMIKNALAKTGSSYKAAKLLGVSQSTVVRKAKKLRITLQDVSD